MPSLQKTSPGYLPRLVAWLSAARTPSRAASPSRRMQDEAPSCSSAAYAVNGWANTRHPLCPPRLTEPRVDECRPVLRYAIRVVADVSTTTAGRGGSSLPPGLGRVVLVSAAYYPAARRPLCSAFHIWISSLSFRSLLSAPCAERRTTVRTAGAASRPRRQC